MDNDHNQRIRAIQKSLNTSIDSYLETPSTQTANIANLQDETSKLTSELKAEIIPPLAQVWELSNLPTVNLAVRLAIDLDMFSILSNGETTLDEFSSKTKADNSILRRILRLLSSTAIIHQRSANAYSPTALSNKLATAHAAAAMKCTFDSLHPHYYDIPDYLKKSEYKEMTLENNALLEKHGVNFWELMGSKPEKVKDFEVAMKVNDDLPSVYKPEYPFVELAKGKKAGGVFLVDCGGGHGAFLKELVVKHPELREEIYVLQDLPEMVANVDATLLPINLKTMAHDITATPQEVKGARIYFFRLVFHALPDEGVVKALRGLHGAIQKGYSKLVIYEQVMPDMGCSIREAMMDVNIMSMCAKERTESMWEELLREGGFVIKQIRKAQAGNSATIEAEMAW